MDNSLKILDCKLYREIKEKEILEKVLRENIKSKLVVIQVGDDGASNSYIKNKLKACERCGIHTELMKFEDIIKEEEILKLISKLNDDTSVTGILVQLPLPKHINSQRVNNSIIYSKDVDGGSFLNKGRLYSNEKSLVPCTAKGIINILKYNNIKIEGKNVVIINRSDLVGKPLIHLFMQNNATVTICHSYTQNLKDISRKADILVVGVGIPNFISNEYINENTVILDVGINIVDGKLCGDVNFNDCIEKSFKITTVPGGVGLLTVTSLLENILEAHSIQVN